MNILYTILSVTFFKINYNKTHKSRLKYEIKHDLYTYNLTVNFELLRFLGLFKNLKKPRFLKQFSNPV